MRRLLIIFAFLASVMASAAGFRERAMAADDNGYFHATGFTFCNEFLQQSRKEQVAKALASSSKKGDLHTRLYDRNYHYILGLFSGFNAGQNGIYNALPEMDEETIVELVIIECARNPMSNLPNVILNVIENNKGKWQRAKLPPNTPTDQTNTAR